MKWLRKPKQIDRYLYRLGMLNMMPFLSKSKEYRGNYIDFYSMSARIEYAGGSVRVVAMALSLPLI